MLTTTGINNSATPSITTIDRPGLLDEVSDVLDLFERGGETYRYVRYGELPPDERPQQTAAGQYPQAQQAGLGGGGMSLLQMAMLAGGIGTGVYFITQAGDE